jgi:hypothetical protein
MRRYWKACVLVVCLSIVPSKLFAQTDICSKLPTVASNGSGTPAEIIVEQMKERTALQTVQENQRANWTSKMISIKNNVPNSTLQALCIFRAEIVPQPALHIISVRSPQDQMAAIEDAVKRLDVPQQGPRSVELTVYVLVASDRDETLLKETPSSLKPVVDQLKSLLSYKQYYLVDTLIGTEVDSRRLNLNGSVIGLRMPPEATDSYTFTANVLIGNGDPLISMVRLSPIGYSMGNGVAINTDIDIPFGKQVVVGKATSGARAFILVASAKLVN